MPQYRFSPLRAAPLILLSTLLSRASADYVLVDDYKPSNFFDKFDFFTLTDPTLGFVDYVNQTYAQRDGLIRNTSDHVYIGVDTTRTYNVYSDRGRPSVRLQSSKSYTHGLFVLDLNHMPYGCGTWPAWWTVGDINTWPSDGEIDIIEGVNVNQNNTNKIYTANKGCKITGKGQSAIADAFDCTDGCGSVSTNPFSYGAGFSMISGGVYAMEWTSDYIRVWFFERSNIPRSITAGQPDSSDFGMPMSNYQGGCDIDRYFRNHKIVFDITFCGQWAGPAFNASPSCPQTPGYDAWDSCKFYVANNASAFQNAYWDINSMKVYQDNGRSSSVAPSFHSFPSTPVSVAGSSFVGSSSGYLRLGQSSHTSAMMLPSSLMAAPSSFAVVQTPGIISLPSTPTLAPAGSLPSVQFSVASIQPCFPISAYLGPNYGLRTGIGDISGGLTMCETTCARKGNCSDVFYVHYEADFSSPLGYWDCWYGPIQVGSVVCAHPTAMKNKRGMELEGEEQPGPRNLENVLALGNSRIQRRQYGRLNSPNLGYRQEDYQVYVLAPGGNMTSNSTFPTPFTRPRLDSSTASLVFSTTTLNTSGFLSFPSISSTTDQMFSILPISVSSEDSFPTSSALSLESASTSDQISSILPISVISEQSFPISTPLASDIPPTDTSGQLFSILPFSFPSSSTLASGTAPAATSNSILPATYTPFPSVLPPLPSSEASPSSPPSDVIYTYPLLTPVQFSAGIASTPSSAISTPPQPDVFSPPSYDYSGETSVTTVSSSAVVTYLVPPANSHLLQPLVVATPVISTASSPSASSSTVDASTSLPPLSSLGHPFGILPAFSEASAILASRASESALSASLATTSSGDPDVIQATYEPPYMAASSPSSTTTQDRSIIIGPNTPDSFDPLSLPSLPSSNAIEATYEPPYMTASSPSSSTTTTTPHRSIIIGPNTPVSFDPSSSLPSSPLSSLIASISASLSAEISSSMASAAATESAISLPSPLPEGMRPTRSDPGILPVFVTASPEPLLPSSLSSVPSGCPVPEPIILTVTVYGSMPPPPSSASPS